MANDQLCDRIEALLKICGGTKDRAFLNLALSDAAEGDVAIAVLDLCASGRARADARGVSLVQEGDQGAESKPADDHNVEAPQASEQAIEDVFAAPIAAAKPAADSEVAPAAAHAESAVLPNCSADSSPEALLDGGLIGTESEPQYTDSDYLAPEEIDRLVARLGYAVSFDDPDDAASSVSGADGAAAPVADPVPESSGVRISVAPKVAFASDAGEGARGAADAKRAVFYADGMDALRLPTRAYNALANRGARTVEDAIRKTSALPRMHGIGEGSAHRALEAIFDSAIAYRADLTDLQVKALGDVCGIQGLMFDQFGVLRLSGGERPATVWGIATGAYSEAAFFAAFPAAAKDVADEVVRSFERFGYPTHPESLRIVAAPIAAEALEGDPDVQASAAAVTVRLLSSLESEDAAYVRAVNQARDVATGASYLLNPVEDGVRAVVDLRDWLGSVAGRNGEILRERLSGKTLQECADAYGVTRERVRQLCAAELSKRPPFVQDSLAPFFDAYVMAESEFCEITGESKTTYCYLEEVSATKKSDRAPLADAIEDDSVPDEWRSRIAELTVHRDTVLDNGARVALRKGDIVAHILRSASDPMSAEELLSSYNDFLARHNALDRSNLESGGLRAFSAYVDRLAFVMYARVVADDGGDKQGIRFYDASERNFSSLEAAVRAYADRNVACTTLWLLNQPTVREAAASLDIRNEYELHYVLGKWCGEIQGVELERVPMIVLGTADRSAQIRGLIEEIGPVDAATLAREYEARYGVKQTTFRGSYLRDFDSLCHDGLYSVSTRVLSGEETAALARELQGAPDICSIDLIVRRGRAGCPSLSADAVTDAAVRPFGYRVEGDLLVRDGVDLRERFAELLAAQPRFSLSDDVFDRDVCESDAFRAALAKAERAFDIVEARKGEYFRIDVFEHAANPLTRDDFKAYLDRTCAFMEPGVPQTSFSLRRAGVTRPLEATAVELGLGAFFFDSVLSQSYVGGRLKRTSINGVAAFCKSTGSFSASDLVEYLACSCGAKTVGDMQAMLFDDYGIELAPAVLRAVIRRSKLRLDEPTGRVYAESDPEGSEAVTRHGI